MVLASIGVGAAAGLSFDDMARLANIAGGLEVEQVGCVCISRLDMINDLLKGGRSAADKYCDLDLVSVHAQARKKTGQKIVLTNGCFDVLHIGHVSYLKQARALGDCLVVAINSDDSVRRLGKAPDRPIFPVNQRAEMLASLECVDYVTVFDEPTPHPVLWKVMPDVLVKGGTYTVEQVVGREIVQSYGGIVKVLGETPGVSTTEILRKLRAEPDIIHLDPTIRKAA
jgi:D-beta-D-heptose 7-phosphate kinase/D-beta-D-heptose 1-phosphate adenosyltransferase